MPQMIVKESTEFVEVEDGAYEAVIEGVEDVAGEYGPQFKFFFRLNTDGNPKVTAYCSQTLSTKSKLYAWCCAILGDLKPGQTVDIPEDLIGKPCRILVANEQSKTDPDRWWPRVKKVGPAKKAKKAEIETEF